MISLLALLCLPAMAGLRTASDANDGNTLSQRETEVLRLMARGASTEEIGQLLALSRNTVISHAKSIYRKLDVHSRAEALAAAASRRLLG